MLSIRLRSDARRRRRGMSVWRPLLVVSLIVAVAAFGVRWSTQTWLAEQPALQIEPLDPAVLMAQPWYVPSPRPFLDKHRVVAYYGNPLAAELGILGEHPPEEMIRRLRSQMDAYQQLDSSRKVVGAAHLIYAIAQESPGDEGLYLARMENDLVADWVELTRQHGLLLFLDIQFGRSTIDRELPYVLPFLKEDHVHLALDPEFAFGPDQYPLIDIGSIDASVVNRTQELLEEFIVANRLPNKILVVHQFRPDMLPNKGKILPSDRVETVIDADGFGSPAIKLDQWNRVIRADGVQRAGIKLFYQHDAQSGGLMTEAEVLALTPSPVVIIYQ